jgi:hypothetical protein
MQVQMHFTTVVQMPNQGTIRFRAVMRNRGLFWFFLDKQKEQEEQQRLLRDTTWIKLKSSRWGKKHKQFVCPL